MNIIYYNDDLRRLIDNLPYDAHRKTVRTIRLLRTYGHLLRMPFSRPIHSGLFELRMHGHWEIRILYAFRSGAAVLLLWFAKKTETTPHYIIEEALRRLIAFEKI